MNKKLSIEWLKAAYCDIAVLEKIVDDSFITQMTSFHAQQSIEKSLKAILEYHEDNVPKKHDVLLLKDKVQKYIQIDNEYILEALNTLYIDSRYPGELGLLPNGKPTLQDAQEFYNFAKDIFYQVCELLEITTKDLQD